MKSKIGLIVGKNLLINRLNIQKGVFFLGFPYLLYLAFIISLAYVVVEYFFYSEEQKFILQDYYSFFLFTFYQAFLATLISIIFGFIFAVVFYLSPINHKFISLLLNICFIIPVIFISYGVINIFSSNGFLSDLAILIDVNYDLNIFSFFGIIFVTSYFNIAFNANFFYRKLLSIPENYLKLFKSNNISFLDAVKIPLRHYLLSGYANVVILTFIFCIGNFTIIYLFAGSPSLSTLELAIYESLNFKADIYSALILGIIQLFMVLILSIPFFYNNPSFNLVSSTRRSSYYPFRGNLIVYFITFWALVFLISPFFILFNGLANFSFDILSSLTFYQSFINSFSVSIISLFLALILSLSSLYLYRFMQERNIFINKYLFLSIAAMAFIPSLSLSAIIFLVNIKLNFILSNFICVAFINSFFVTPVVFIFLLTRFLQNYQNAFKLCSLYKINPLTRFFKIDLFFIKEELLIISAAVFVLSFGDLTSVTIFNDQSFMTVPYYISQLYSSYRYNDSFFVLSVFVLIIFFIVYLSSKFVSSHAKN